MGELDAGGGESRIEGEREALGGGAIGELVLLRKFAADEVIDAGIVGPGGEGGGAMLGGADGIARDVGDDGTEGVGLGRVRVYGEGEVEVDGGEIAAFGVDEMFGEEKVRGDVTRVDGEGALGVGDELFAVAVLEGSGEAPEEVGIVGGDFEAGRERARGEGEVAFFEGEPTGNEEGVAGRRLGALGGAEEVFQGEAGIEAGEETGFAHDGLEFGGANVVGAAAHRGEVHGADDLADVDRGGVGIAGVKRGFAGEEAQVEIEEDGGAEFVEAFGGFGVAAEVEEGAGFDGAPGFVFLAILGGDGAGGVDDVFVVADAEVGAGFIDRGGVKLGGDAGDEQREQERGREAGKASRGRSDHGDNG